jgi:hypothetical protein
MLIEHGPQMTSPWSSSYFQHLGGATSRPAIDTAAFGHRDAVFDFAILTVWQDEAEDVDHLTGARVRRQDEAVSDWRLLQQAGRRRGRPGQGRIRPSDLRPTDWSQLKDTYDPTKVFLLNQNIRPSPA